MTTPTKLTHSTHWWKGTSMFIAFLLLTILSANAQFTNIPVTGFNNDIVANGTGDGTNGTNLNTISTGNMNGMVTQPTIGVDGVGYTLIDATYKWYSASAAPTCFMPTGGAVPSALTPGLTYQLQSYSGLNARTVVSNTYSGSVWPTTGSLSLVTPASYGTLYVLYESVMNTAGPTITATVTFTDLTTQVFPGNTIVNWFTATGIAYNNSGAGISRAQNVAPGAANACATGPYLFQMTLPISPANYAKQVQSISFAWSAATGTTANTVDYFHAMAVGGIAPCTGTPAPGNTVASVNPTCSGVNFTLSLQNPTGAGATYQWQSSPDGSTWTNVAAATNATLTTSQTAATYYQCLVTCTAGPSTGISNPVYVTMSAPNTCYCTPTTTGGTTYFISNMLTTGGITNLNNTSGSSAGYQNFFATASMSALQGSTVNYTMTVAGGSTYGRAIWIDFNQNGTFEAGEQVASSTTYLGSPLTGSFTVPLTATTGTTRMRVVATFTPNNPSNPCTNSGLGEYEDYAFDVVLLQPCATPSAQPALVSLAAVSTSQINGSFNAAAGSPSGYLVVRYPSPSSEVLPVNGTVYVAGNSLGLGTVVQVSAATSFNNTGLNGGTAYDYYVYSYNTLCAGAPFYLTTGGFFGTQSTNSCSAMSGVVPIGPTAPAAPAGFPTLSGAGGALAYIVTNGLGGNTILELQSDYTSAYAAANETYPLTFNSNACINSSKTLTIRPASGVASAIALTSANSTLATVVLDGASYITFDGRNGGTGTNKFLQIVNTSSTAAAAGNAVMMRNDASNNTLTFLDLQASNLNPASNSGTITAGAVPGVVSILSSTAGASGNDNNTISDCDIHSATAVGNILNVGIYAFNNTAVGNTANNDNNTITNNNIYDCFHATTATAGIDILVGNNNYTITNNSFYKSAGIAYTYTGAVAHRGFWITPNASAVASSGFVITGNWIGGTAPSCGGSAFTTTSSVANIFNGMDISVGTASFTSVQNNTVTNFNHSTSNTGSTAFVGFNIAAGNVNVGTITGNLVGSTTVNGAITFTANANTGGVIGIRTGGGTTVNISNNTVSGIDLVGSATITPVFNGINANGGTTVNIANNTIGSTSLANSINASSAYTGTTGIQTIRGIIVNAGTTSTVTGNTIANMNTNLTSLSGAHTMAGIAVTVGTSTVSGNTIRSLTSSSQSTSGGNAPSVIGIAYTSTTAPATINGNTIHTLKNTNTTTTSGPVVAGISYGGPSGAANLIEKNNIHSLVLSSNTVSASAAITGMDIATGQVTIRNNMIRLGYDENGNSIVVPTLIRGISKNTNIANIYFNSIFIGGTGVLSTVAANTFAFTRTAAASTDDIRNNIFVNNRSNATTGGKHYQISLSSIATLNLNYNDYYGVGTGTVFASNVGVDVAAYSAGWVASDASSQAGDPQFINPTGSAATGDLHIHPTNQTIIEQNGINIATVFDDFDSQTRSTLTPNDMGADAGDFIGFFCSGPPASATATLTVPGPVCGNVTKTINLSGFTPLPGYTYQWQESTTGLPGSFVNVTGGVGANTSSYTTATLNTSMYYQCEIACAFGAGTTTSNAVFAEILLVPVLAVTPATGISVCSGANVDLSASGANTYTWTVNPGVAGYPVVSLLTTRNNLANVTSRPTSTLASSTTTPPATVATPTWTYTVTGTALNGCTSQAVIVLNVITSPVVPIQLTYTNAPDPVCATGSPVTFTVNNPGTIGAGSWTYNWYDQTGTTLLQSTTNTSSTDTYTPATPVANGNYIYQVKVSNTVCPASYAVASPSYFVGYTSLNVVSNANCGDNGTVIVYPEGQNSFTTWYSNNFATGLLGPAFDASFGNTNFTGGRCNITPQANGQTGALIIRNSAFINSNNLQVDFKLSTAPRGFAFNILGADGLCWSYANDVTVGTVTTGGSAEGGSGTGLKLAFDATANGPNNQPGCYLMFNSTTVGQGPGDPGVLAYRLGSWWQGLVDAPVSIVISQNGFVTVSVNNEVIFDHVALPASYLTSNKSNWIHSFTARTGGSNELHAIDDLNIRYNSYEYSNNSTTGLDGTWQTSNLFSGLAAATYPIWVRNPTDPTCVSNVGNAVVGTSPSPSSAITVAAPGFNTTICAGSSTDLTTDVSIPGAVFLWESSANIGGPYVPASGINNAGTYSTDALLANTYFRCTFTCPSSSPVTSAPALVTVNSGSVASTNSPVIVNCLNSTATVTANPGPNTTIVWYAAASGGSPLFSGSSYSITPPSFPTTYYAEPVTTVFTNHYDFGGEKSVGGNLNGGSIGGTNIASKFNTTASIRIDSIKVLPNAAGTLTVALQNAGSATNILSFNQVISAAQVGTFVNVPVNFAIAGSGNYQLTTTGVSCSYNNAYPPANYGLSYMNLGGVFSIVGGSTTPTGATSTSVYGTSYNWSITTSCPTGGARVPVVVDINPASLVTVTPSSSTFCVGGFAQLVASSPTIYSDYGWSPVTNLFLDSLGTTPYTAGTNEDTVYAIPASGGSITYTASTAVTGCTNTATGVVTGNPSPVIVASTTTPVLCNGDTAEISVNITEPLPGNYSVVSIPHAPLDPAGSSDWGAGPSGDDAQVATTLPFPFTYFGTAYTNVNIYTNGFIQFGTSSNSTTVYGATIPSAAAPNNIVALAWEDFNVVSPDSVRFYTVGVTPNRQWVAEWVNVDFYITGGNVSGQIVLNEADNTIDIYHTNIDNNNNQTACGIENSNGTYGLTPPNRNFSIWTPNPVVNEAWKFTPLPAAFISWSGANIIGATTNANIQANPSSSGYFTVTVTNPLNGCTRADSVLIGSSVNPKPIIADNDTNLCNPDFIYVNVVDTGFYVGGYPAGTNFTWSAIGVPIPDLDSISSSNGSSYSVIVTLPSGCSANSDTATVLTKSVAVVDVITNASCTGGGAIAVEVTSGLPDYNYIWSTDLAQTNVISNVTKANNRDTLSNLTAGTYYLQVYDEAGTPASCNSGVLTYIVAGTSPIVIDSVVGTNISCTGFADGTATVYYTGGTAPYSIVWSDAQFADVPSRNISAGGTFTVTVSDGSGCADTAAVTIIEPLPLGITLSSTPASIGGPGSATALGVDGTAPYTYEWLDSLGIISVGVGSPINLPSALYYGVVTDANNCQFADTIRIDSITDASFNLTMLIEGFYNGAGGLTPALQNSGVGLSGTECDTIYVELRDQLTPANVLASGTAVLNTSGQASFTFPGSVIGENGYIAVFHRNAVQTWSDLMTFSSVTNYNFTTAATQAYGSNMILVAPGLYAFYSGDVNQDGTIDIFDQIELDNDIFNFNSGYLPTDITGDGGVDVFDQIIMDNNIFNFIGSTTP